MASNLELAEAFIRACDGRDIAAACDFLAEDCVYHNIPMEPIHGRAASLAFLSGMGPLFGDWKWELHHIAEGRDGAVLTERTDRFRTHDGRWLGVRVMGVFEFHNGKISAWRDYYDAAEANAMIAAASGQQ